MDFFRLTCILLLSLQKTVYMKAKSLLNGEKRKTEDIFGEEEENELLSDQQVLDIIAKSSFKN